MSLQRSGVSNSFGVKSLKAKDFLRGLPLIDAIFLEPRNLFLEKLETIFPDVYSEDSPFRGFWCMVNSSEVGKNKMF